MYDESTLTDTCIEKQLPEEDPAKLIMLSQLVRIADALEEIAKYGIDTYPRY